MAVKKNRAKKENPTWFDVNEAKRKGVDMGLTFCVTVLTDKMGFDQDKVVEFMNHVADLCVGVNEGRVNLKDLKQIQLEEYKMDFR
jgi:hypothetical protein